MSDKKQLYMVEGISTFHMRYLILAESREAAMEFAKSDEKVDSDFSQRHLGEEMLTAHVVSEDEAVTEFHNGNPYLSNWTSEEILRKVVYETDTD